MTSSKVRVGVEHAIGGVKRCRVVADTFRHLRAGFVDEAMELASDLHNLHEGNYLSASHTQRLHLNRHGVMILGTASRTRL